MSNNCYISNQLMAIVAEIKNKYVDNDRISYPDELAISDLTSAAKHIDKGNFYKANCFLERFDCQQVVPSELIKTVRMLSDDLIHQHLERLGGNKEFILEFCRDDEKYGLLTYSTQVTLEEILGYIREPYYVDDGDFGTDLEVIKKCYTDYYRAWNDPIIFFGTVEEHKNNRQILLKNEEMENDS